MEINIDKIYIMMKSLDRLNTELRGNRQKLKGNEPLDGEIINGNNFYNSASLA